MEDSGLNSSVLSPFCDSLPEIDCQGPEFPLVEELTLDPYSNAPMQSSLCFVCVKHKKQFNTIKADMNRTQREYYDKSSRELNIAEGKQVYVRRPPPSSQPERISPTVHSSILWSLHCYRSCPWSPGSITTLTQIHSG